MESVDDVVREIMRIRRSLPARPSVDDVEAALLLIRNVEKEEQTRLELISRRRKGPDVPEELFSVLREMEKSSVLFHGKEQKREALWLLELENAYEMFDEMVHRASQCVSPSSDSKVLSTSIGPSTSSMMPSRTAVEVRKSMVTGKGGRSGSERFAQDDSCLKAPKLNMDSLASRNFPPTNTTSKAFASSGEDAEKLSLIKLASMIEVCFKKGTKVLDLQNKLLDQIEWLPDSIGKLFALQSLDLSENRLVALPSTIGDLSSLTKLDLRSNRIVELSGSLGSLSSLEYLYLSGNQLTVLPSTFGKLTRLVELDVSSNRLSSLPDVVGNLVNLKKLIVETNDIEEIPYTIGNCASLVELRAEYNRLKGLPEAIGRLASLEILSIRYNNIKNLPTTMASLSHLREMDVSFNELESIPESLCLATTLVKLNIGNNFADLQSLPRSIGNLEMLEELDMSNNQIRILPDSFAMLAQLRVLNVEENPLEVPPRSAAEMGAQAVVKYMADLLASRDAKQQHIKPKKSWTQFFMFPGPNKRKHDGFDYLKT